MAKNEHLFPYEWRLSDGYPAKGIKHHGCKVFGTFICGGGSTMGYKLAGYDHLGGVELDPKVAAIYQANHHPQMLYVEDIRDFNKREDLPEELYQLDILDGSPPCSTFSMAGSREKAWGKQKHFAEGQKLQRLDDLTFVYCDTIAKLKPKVCWLENVAGLVRGNAKIYAKQIAKRLDEIGYNVQVFLLNSATMGVPQIRERVFFIGLRKDFHLPKLVLNFNEKPILFGEIIDRKENKHDLTDIQFELWKKQIPSDNTLADVRKRNMGRDSGFTDYLVSSNRICNTITASGKYICKEYPRWFNKIEYCKVGTFPIDYEFGKAGPQWYIGMSVPPVMTAQIANQIYLQWLCKLK
jgi:DNA (cytosine-5)-methyltransferase 1